MVDDGNVFWPVGSDLILEVCPVQDLYPVQKVSAEATEEAQCMESWQHVHGRDEWTMNRTKKLVGKARGRARQCVRKGCIINTWKTSQSKWKAGAAKEEIQGEALLLA